jgi:hypothetical protein
VRDCQGGFDNVRDRSALSDGRSGKHGCDDMRQGVRLSDISGGWPDVRLSRYTSRCKIVCNRFLNRVSWRTR